MQKKIFVEELVQSSGHQQPQITPGFASNSLFPTSALSPLLMMMMMMHFFLSLRSDGAIQGGLDTGLLLLWWQLWWCLNIWMAQRWLHNTLIQQARNGGFSMALLINHLIIHPWSIAPISSGRWGTSLVQLFS